MLLSRNQSGTILVSKLLVARTIQIRIHGWDEIQSHSQFMRVVVHTSVYTIDLQSKLKRLRIIYKTNFGFMTVQSLGRLLALPNSFDLSTMSWPNYWWCRTQHSLRHELYHVYKQTLHRYHVRDGPRGIYISIYILNFASFTRIEN